MYFISSNKFFFKYWFDTTSRATSIKISGKFGNKFFNFKFYYYYPFFSKCNKVIYFFSPHKKYISTFNSFFSNSFFGVNSGYFKYLELKGVGFKVLYSLSKHCLFFFLGYNHVTAFYLPFSVQAKVRKQFILVFSYDNATLSHVCSQIKLLRLPDPYRGKGIIFKDELLKFKPGKQR